MWETAGGRLAMPAPSAEVAARPGCRLWDLGRAPALQSWDAAAWSWWCGAHFRFYRWETGILRSFSFP